ncbi:MAG TPA: CHAT domain-containing tetratricopeptide repeat protein [Gemmataceae bacterium]|nr:CHAT domain-containing tetratricopeptide repeat protein [Gemmataceae bacterium]
MHVRLGVLVLLAFCTSEAVAEEPPYRRLLHGEDASKAATLEKQIAELQEGGKYAEAQKRAVQVLALRKTVQGETHWQTADALRTLRTLEHIAALPASAQAELIEVSKLDTEAERLKERRQYTEGIAQLQRALAIRRRHLGEQHADVATALSDLAAMLSNAGKYADADPLNRQALAIRRKVLGEDHPVTAQSYGRMAINLNSRGKYGAAEPLCRQALAIDRKVLGEADPETAGMFEDLAYNLNAQGKYAEAEPFGRQALAIRRKVQGDDHADTAYSYLIVGGNLDDQGKHAEAEPLLRMALATSRKILGENHVDLAMNYTYLAFNLDAQHKEAEAEPLHRQALAIRRKAFGENHPMTALSYDNLATNVGAQRKYSEAETLHRQALAIRRKVLSEDHPRTAMSYNNLAFFLHAQGKYAEADSLARQGLAILRKHLGDPHPHTAAAYTIVAATLEAQDNYVEAEQLWAQAAQSFEIARWRSSRTGLERASTTVRSPFRFLATCRARLGQPVAAWRALEAGLARGLLDDLSAVRAQFLSPDEQQRLDTLTARLDQLDGQIAALLASKEQKAADMARYRELAAQRETATAELDRFASDRAAREVYDLERIQAFLPADTALLSWIDISDGPHAARPGGAHWACLVRQTGTPVWVQLPGNGTQHTWTEKEDSLPARLRKTLAEPPGARLQEWQQLAQQTAAQRLIPLESHLQGIRHLVVLAAWKMAGLPIEAFTDRYTVSYAPSATVFARLQEQRQKQRAAGDSRPSPAGKLLALGDPAFPTVTPSGPHPKASPTAADRTLPIGQAPAFAPLPGTRIETHAIAQLFPESVVLLGADASVPRLAQLAGADQLRQFRYLHLATHGIVNNQIALDSALILAPDPAPDPAQLLPGGQPLAAGRLTAKAMLQSWKLNADLVVLSACQSALGRQADGEGYLGFTQALFLAGARSLVLSLWKVDDTATELLMVRFYQNLLGKREGLPKPMPKAEALREAKNWLRELPRAERDRLAAALKHEEQRGTLVEKKHKPVVPIERPGESDGPPYAHPYYWAAFVLYGDPQ